MNKLLQLWDVVPFSREAAETYARLTMKHPNRKAGFDRLIVAHAIIVGVPLVTKQYDQLHALPTARLEA